jgi:acyl carrier protein
MDFNEFKTKFADQLEIEDITSLNQNTLFKELEEWSSLSILELIVLFDEEFEKQIGDGDIAKCQTIADLYNLAIG